MGYLICNKCGSYYKLQPGETVEDFINECECGGILEYKVTIPTTNTKTSTNQLEQKEGIKEVWKKQKPPIKVLSIIGFCLVAFLLIGVVSGMFNSTKDNSQLSGAPLTTNNTNTSSQVQAGTVTINNPTFSELIHYKQVYDPNFKMEMPREDYTSYVFTGELVPSTNFNYLEVVIKYYDTTGKVLGKKTVWSITGLKGGEKYSIRNEENITASKIDVMVFDIQNSSEDSKALYKKTINI